VTAHAYGEAGGQFRQTFTFTDRAGVACQLAGWPTIDVLDAAGRAQAEKIERVRQGSPSVPAWRPVTVKPLRTGSFDLYGADWNARADRACAKTSAVLITPRGNRSHLRVPVRDPDCGTPLFISPIIAGSSDAQAWSEVVG